MERSMSLFIAFVFFGLFCTGCEAQSCGSDFVEEDYALIFPNKGTTDYAVISRSMPDLNEFTLCYWMKSTDKGYATPFSYCTQSVGNGNELLILDYGKSTSLTINGQARLTSYSDSNLIESTKDDRWHHFCFSWTNSDGSWQLYLDGDLITNDTAGLQKGHTIKGNGIVTLGQDQDLDDSGSCGGEFSSGQSFQGSLTNLNLWSFKRSVEKIQEMSQRCLLGEGDVLKWSDFKSNLRGQSLKVDIPAPCVPPQV